MPEYLVEVFERIRGMSGLLLLVSGGFTIVSIIRDMQGFSAKYLRVSIFLLIISLILLIFVP
jgi:hypothetical protein